MRVVEADGLCRLVLVQVSQLSAVDSRRMCHISHRLRTLDQQRRLCTIHRPSLAFVRRTVVHLKLCHDVTRALLLRYAGFESSTCRSLRGLKDAWISI